jgi:hypothetical protein
MAIFAFRRMREQNEAAEKAASLVQTQAKPKPKRKPQKVTVNGDNS